MGTDAMARAGTVAADALQFAHEAEAVSDAASRLAVLAGRIADELAELAVAVAGDIDGAREKVSEDIRDALERARA